MAQRKQITWSELRVGLFVLVGLLILAVAIFYVTGAGFLGPKYRLKTYLPEVSGLAVGAPVRLDGVEIGNVERIRLVPREAGKPPDRMHNIEVDIRPKGEHNGVHGQAGQGTHDKLFMTDELHTKVDKGMDNVNAILADVRSQKGTIGKLLYDPTLYDQAKAALENGNTIMGDIRAGKGTLGKLTTDETLYNKLRDTSTNLSEATSKLNKSDNSVGKIFNDPQLYDNMAAASAELRAFLTEFRKNPKKYLTVKLSFF